MKFTEAPEFTKLVYKCDDGHKICYFSGIRIGRCFLSEGLSFYPSPDEEVELVEVCAKCRHFREVPVEGYCSELGVRVTENVDEEIAALNKDPHTFRCAEWGSKDDISRRTTRGII